MTFFIQIRTSIKQFISRHEEWAGRILRFVIAFVALFALNQNFGYQKTLSQWWVALLLALVCMFLPIRGLTVVVLFFGMIQLLVLSPGVAGVTLLLIVVSYAVCAYFSAGDTYNFIMMPLFLYLKIPFAMPLGVGLLRRMEEITTVICGGILSFYLSVVRDNASLFLDETSDMTVTRLLQNQLLNNNMFYIYLISLVVCYLAVYYIRTLKISYAWFVAVSAGLAAEFILMLAGCLFSGGRSEIPSLIIGNLIVLGLGYLAVFFLQGLDYARTERVQYEDDEYYYFVTAVPKSHIAQPSKEIKKITDDDVTN